MDINDWRGISTIFVMLAFFGVCWWAFAPKRRQRFDEDAQLPFADEEQHQNARQHFGRKPEPDPEAAPDTKTTPDTKSPGSAEGASGRPKEQASQKNRPD